MTSLDKTGSAVAQMAVAVPVVHLSVCSVFLMGYVATFGGNVSSLFSINDILAVSLGGVAATYISGLAMPTLLNILHFTSPSRENRLSDGSIVLFFRRNPTIYDYIPIVIGAVLIIFASLLNYNDRMVPFVLLFNGMILLNLPQIHRMLEKRGLYNFKKQMIISVALFVVMAFATGMDRGEIHRRETYDNLIKSNLLCGQVVILNRVSDNYIGAVKNNSRVVVDESCKVLFIFPSVNVFSNKPFTFFGL